MYSKGSCVPWLQSCIFCVLRLPSQSSVLIGVTIAVPCRGCLSGEWQWRRGEKTRDTQNPCKGCGGTCQRAVPATQNPPEDKRPRPNNNKKPYHYKKGPIAVRHLPKNYRLIRYAIQKLRCFFRSKNLFFLFNFYYSTNYSPCWVDWQTKRRMSTSY